MSSTFRHWALALLVAVVPAQAALAAGGLWCATGAAANPSISVAHHSQHAVGHAATYHGHDSGQADQDEAPLSPGAYGTCAACAPCSGSLAPPAAPSAGPDLAQDDGADFLPVLVLIRPARLEGLERPPRTI